VESALGEKNGSTSPWQAWITIPPLLSGIVLVAPGIAAIVTAIADTRVTPGHQEQRLAGGPSSIRQNIRMMWV